MRVKSLVVAVSLMVLAGRADASPIESVKCTCDVLLGTASAFSLSGSEASARVASFEPGESLPFQTASIGLANAAGGPLLVSSVGAPVSQAFQEPSALVIVLIDLGIVALGSIRLRR